jgi:recombinational DNA repair ATPase RecF
MEERVLKLEFAVEQNTKMLERLDRSMAQLNQSMVALRVQMGQGFADLRQEMAQGQADLRKEMAQGQIELLREMAANYEKLQNKISSVPEKSHRGTTTGFVNLQNHFDPIFCCLLALNFIIAFVILGLVAKDFIGFYLK